MLYCDYWRKKLHSKPKISFPKKLSPAIADITEEFSFAYLKEAFVATLLVMAARHADDDDDNGKASVFQPWDSDKGDDLKQYELYREMKVQVKILRDDMSSSANNPTSTLNINRVPPTGESTDVRVGDDGMQPALTSTEALRRDLAIRGVNNGMPKREITSRRAVAGASILGNDIDFLPDGVLQG